MQPSQLKGYDVVYTGRYRCYHQPPFLDQGDGGRKHEELSMVILQLEQVPNDVNSFPILPG